VDPVLATLPTAPVCDNSLSFPSSSARGGILPEGPEQKARHEIDANLTAAGWTVQSADELDLTAARGIAVREFQMKSGFGFADYLLYLDRKAIGAVEAKAEGTLSGVEAQTAKYAAGLPINLPAHVRPLPFLFESTAKSPTSRMA
jgi:type I restriction enzyme R subunit